MNNTDNGKSFRILNIYNDLLNGKVLRKADLAVQYDVNEKSIQRDFEEIRNFLDSLNITNGVRNELIYDYQSKGYRFDHINQMKFTNDEVLAICKILLDSRAFRKDDMNHILDKLIDSCVPKENQKLVNELVSNERYHYIPPHHNSHFTDKLWIIGQAIRDNQKIEFFYKGIQGTQGHKRIVEPLAIMFSEYYFYLTGIVENVNHKEAFTNPDDIFPTIYRIDRIQNLTLLKEHFHIPYANRFEEGEFRKRIQFMFGGKLRRIKFEYSGYSVESVLDRIPTAKILEENDGKYIMQAEVFGNGIDMWIRSQGDYVKLLS